MNSSQSFLKRQLRLAVSMIVSVSLLSSTLGVYPVNKAVASEPQSSAASGLNAAVSAGASKGADDAGSAQTSGAKAANSKLSAALQDLLESSRQSGELDTTHLYKVLIKLKAQADGEAAGQGEGSNASMGSGATGAQKDVQKREQLVGEWEELANRTQASLLDRLEQAQRDGQAKNIKSFYIINAIALEASPALIGEIAKRDEVERIDHSGIIKPIDPIKDKSRKKRSVPAEQDGIEWGLKMISAPRVWDELHITGRGVKVGIIDGGTYYEHPALIKKFEGYVPGDGVYTRGYYFDAVDEGLEKARPEAAYDHGTHVAGIILGDEGPMNRIGVAPGASFIAARAIGNEQGSTEDLLEAAEWMLKPGGRASNAPRIINNSWGGDPDNNEWFKEVADKWRAAKILPVFAAGNTSGELAKDGSIANPGNLFNVFTSAAVDSQGRLAAFSKVGPSAFGSQKIKPDVSAPGVEIRSSMATGGYASLSGTSMAAPHVAGTAALMLEANPKLSVDEIESILKETATPSSASRFGATPNMGMGYGTINAYDAVRKALAMKAGDSSDQRIDITGHVYKKGDDTQSASIEDLSAHEAYLGRSVGIKARIKDDVSVLSAKVYYKFDEAAEAAALSPEQAENFKQSAQVLEMKRTGSGSENDAVWKAVIPADKLKGHTKLSYLIEAQDFSQKFEYSKPGTLAIKKGISPDAYANDFEQQADGWVFTGELDGFEADSDWSWGSPSAPREPKPLNGSKLIGIKLGSNTPTVHLDSYAYLPPIDLSNPALKQANLSFDEYVGVNGVTSCEIQVATSEQGPWTKLDEKLIPPGTQAQWQRVNYSLEKWLHKSEPVHLRLYFHFPDHGEGSGWYIDNLSLTSKDSTAPDAVTGLRASVKAPGAGTLVSWDAVSNNDVVSYELYRFDGLSDKGAVLSASQLTHLASVPKDNHELSFYDLEGSGKDVSYVVRAKDSVGNESAVKEIVSVPYDAARKPFYAQNFNDQAEVAAAERLSAGDFKAYPLEGHAQDWELGSIKPVGNDDSTFIFREIMIGLRDKIARADKLWGTNLGREDASLPKGIYNAQVSPSQNSALELKELQLPKLEGPFAEGLRLQFESFNALHYLTDYQENLEQVEISTDEGKSWNILLSPQEVMAVSDKFKFSWKEADLSAYAGKKVRLRFVLQTSSKQVINPYEIGWYIDNVIIGAKPVEYKAQTSKGLEPKIELAAVGIGASASGNGAASVLAATTAAAGSEVSTAGGEAAVGTAGGVVPLKGAMVELVELTQEQQVESATGAFAFKTSKPKAGSSWTLQASAYGYKTQSVAVPADSTGLTHDFILEPLAAGELQGLVKDKAGQPIEGAFVRVVDDANIEQVKTGSDGRFVLKGLLAGKHILRAYKAHMSSADQEITYDPAAPQNPEFVLEAQDLTDDTLHFDNGTAKLNLIFKQPGKAAAVRFYPAKKGGYVKSIKAYFARQEGVEDTSVRFMLMQEDENKRMVTKADIPYKVTPEAWNEVDLQSYKIQTDKAFYAMVLQINPNGSAYGVALDTQGLEDAGPKNSFLYNGTFVPARSQNVAGAFMIRAAMAYPKDAQANEPDPLSEDDASKPGIGAGSGVANSADDFEWELTDDQGARVKKYIGSSKTVVIPKEHEGKPVTEIGPNAFAWKYLDSLTIPEGVQKIGDASLSAAFKPSAQATLKLPPSVTELGKNAFNGSGLARLVAPGVTKLGPQVFNRSNGLIIEMPKLTSMDAAAFGDKPVSGFKYNQLYVDDASALSDIDGLVLINPARVNVKVYLRASEKLDLEKTLYGPGDTAGYENTYKPEDFYKMGQTVTITAPRNITVSYYEQQKEIHLAKSDNPLSFEADVLKATVKPVYAGEHPVVEGKTLPKVTIRFLQELDDSGSGAPLEVTADDYGFFSVPVSAKTLSDQITMEIVDASGKKFTQKIKVQEALKADQLFVIESNTSGRILDYLGEGGAVQVPSVVSDKNGSQRNVRILGSKALAHKNISELAGFDKLERLSKIEDGALMGNKLTSLRFPNNVKEIGSAALAQNALKEVYMPRLLHKIGPWAFKDNQIETLKLGEFTGHFGAYSFANNSLASLKIPAKIEELEEGAFMNNRLIVVEFERPSSDVSISGLRAASLGSADLRAAVPVAPAAIVPVAIAPAAPVLAGALQPAAPGGHSHVLTELSSKVFAGNQLKELSLPVNIARIAPDAFADNGQIVNVLSENKQLEDSILSENSGHIINGANVLIHMLDEKGDKVAADKLYVGPGLEKRVGDAATFFRIDKEALVEAPTLEGYEALEASKSITPKRGVANELSFVYKKLASADEPAEGKDPAEGIKPVDPTDGTTPEDGKAPAEGTTPAEPSKPDPSTSPEGESSKPGETKPGNSSQPADKLTDPAKSADAGGLNPAQSKASDKTAALKSGDKTGGKVHKAVRYIPHTAQQTRAIQAVALASVGALLTMLGVAYVLRRKQLNNS